MSENAYQPAQSGQEVQQGDVDQLGTTSGLADDHVFAELLRLAPYNGVTVSKAIMPAGFKGNLDFGVVQPSGRNDGSISVNPFRAVVGSRNAVAAPPSGISTDSDALANWRDIRSGVFVGSATDLVQAFVLAPNTSGNPRWDLAYAAIVPDTAGPSVQRRVKDPTSGNITVATVPAYIYSPVTVAILTGTPGTTPALPTLPADGAGTYNIPIAYIRVPNGFSSTSTVATQDIRSTTVNGVMDYVDVRGGLKARPCNGNNDGNATFNAGGSFAWNPASAGNRPGPWLPPDWIGGSVFVAEVDNESSSSAAWSVASLGIVDNSIDWRNRIIKVAGSWSGTYKFGNDPTGYSGTGILIPNASQLGTTLVPTGSLGSTFASDGVNPPSTTTYVTVWQAAQSGQTVALLVNMTDGSLRWYSTGNTLSRYFFWIESTGQFPNT